jgi:hypothetical protein
MPQRIVWSLQGTDLRGGIMLSTTFTSEPPGAMGVTTSASKRHANSGHKNHVKLHDRQAGQSAGPLVQGSGIFLSLLAAEKQRALQPAAKSGFLTPDAGRTTVRRGQGEHTQTQAESAALAGAGRKKEQGSLPGALTAGKQAGKQDRKGVRTALSTTGRRVRSASRCRSAPRSASSGRCRRGCWWMRCGASAPPRPSRSAGSPPRR